MNIEQWQFFKNPAPFFSFIVTVAEYNKTKCPVSFENEIDIPLSVRTGRLGCMTFDYLIGQNKKENAECEIKVQYREFVSNRWVAKPVHTFKDKFEFNVWMPFRRDFDVILEENKKYRVSVTKGQKILRFWIKVAHCERLLSIALRQISSDGYNILFRVAQYNPAHSIYFR